MNWNIQIDHLKPISKIDVSKDEELRVFNWITNQPLFEKDNLQEGCNFDSLAFRF